MSASCHTAQQNANSAAVNAQSISFLRTLIRKLVEICPEFHIERHLEDHESVAEAYNAWPPTSAYYFEMRKDADKYSLFVKPDVRPLLSW